MSVNRRFSLQISRKFRPSSDSPPSISPSNSTEESKPAEDVDFVPIKIPASGFSISDIPAYVDALKNVGGVGINDRNLLLEKLLILMSKNKDKEFSVKLQRFVINLLYNDLPHPPTGYLGLLPTRDPSVIEPLKAKVKYAFRTSDGSNNNPLYPTLGQAGSPYARSVPSTRIAPQAALPDPGLVFDTLLKRDAFRPHPGGLSALFFSFADLVIHSVFNTDHHDWSINNSSSYLDLSILYGNNDAEVAKVRRHDGTGKLWDDTFADSRLLLMPPAACALLVLLSRNHNFIAQKILDINENGNLKADLPESPERDAQDEEIFQRARLVNCGFFIHIILGDYVGAILGLVRDASDWRLDPLMIMREIDHEFTPTGQGNVVSLEFNQLYRWHATLSKEDAEWTGKVFDRFFEGKSSKDVTISDFKNGAHKNIPSSNPREWSFGSIKRGNDGRFKDSDLANILLNSTDSRAAAFGAKGTPETLRIVEIMGMMQSRKWSTCSLNEFRKFIGLKPYSTFAEWNPDPAIHTVAETLYQDIDNLELYVGLQAEEVKNPMGGAGLCPGYTLSRAILADAVALVRGDRFMTTELTPYNLTSWGFQYTRYDKQDGSYGGLLTRLLFQTLPDHYPRGNAYAHFPFLVPSWFRKFCQTEHPDIAEKYTWERPTAARPLVLVDSFAEVKRIVGSPDFISNYDKQGSTLVKPFLTKRMSKDTLKSMEKLERSTTSPKALGKGAQDITNFVFSSGVEEDAAAYFTRKVDSLIKEKTFPPGAPTTYVDIIRDVINLLPVHWVCRMIGLPLKTTKNLNGLWTEHQAYEMFAEISRYIYLNYDASYDWHLRESAQAYAQDILESVKINIHKVDSWLSSGAEPFDGHDSTAFLKKIWQHHGKKLSHREFSAQLFLAMIPTAPLFSQAISVVIDYYLGDESNGRQTERGRIVELHQSKEKDAHSKILGYIFEALRQASPVSGVYRTAAKETDIGGVRVDVGTRVWASVANGNLDPTVFPKTTDYSRPADKSAINAFAEFGLLRSKFFEATAPAIIGSILSLKELQRGPGPSGKLSRFYEEQNGTNGPQFITMRGTVGPWPDSLVVQYASV